MLTHLSLLYLVAALQLGGVAHAPRVSRPARPAEVVASADSAQACEAADLELRRAALHALMQTAPERLPALLEQLKQHPGGCSPALRLELLTQEYGAGRSGQFDQHAARLRFARDLATSDADTAVRQVAVGFLGNDTTAAGCEALAAAAKNAPTATLRATALSIMLSLRHPHAAPQLRALYPTVQDPSLKANLIDAVAQMDTLAWPWLLGVASAAKEPHDLRARALALVLPRAVNGGPTGAPGRTTGIPTTEALGEAYGKLTESAWRQQVIGVLAQRTQEDAAAEQLARVAKTDPDYSLRRQAVEGLQASKSERAAPLLAGIAVK